MGAPEALPGPVELCFQVETAFPAGLYRGGDYWNVNGDRPLRGLWVEIIDNVNNTSLIESGFTNTDGCVDVWLDPSKDYTILYDTRIKLGIEEAEALYCTLEDVHPVDPEGYYDANCRDDIDAWEWRTEVMASSYSPPNITVPFTLYFNAQRNPQTIWLAVVGRILLMDAWNYSTSCPLQLFEKPFGLGGCGIQHTDAPGEIPDGAQVCSS